MWEKINNIMSKIKNLNIKKCFSIILEHWKSILISSLIVGVIMSIFALNNQSILYKTTVILELASAKTLIDKSVSISPIEEQGNVIYLLKRMPIEPTELIGCISSNTKENQIILENLEFIKIIKGPSNIIQFEVKLEDPKLSNQCATSLYQVVEKLQKKQIEQRKNQAKQDREIIDKIISEGKNEKSSIQKKISEPKIEELLASRMYEFRFNMLSIENAGLNLITPINTDTNPIKKGVIVKILFGLIFGFLLSFFYWVIKE